MHGDGHDDGIADRGVDGGDVGQVAVHGAVLVVIVAEPGEGVGVTARAIAAFSAVRAGLFAVLAGAARQERAVGHEHAVLGNEAYGRGGLEADGGLPHLLTNGVGTNL